ncbi:hypothetical protein [Brucella pseudogrignonensis]|uniref:Uncharacterized protein n=1 Tax=Brucella pseudogrignonensis TaxID=419475 RepID=A0ABU1M612_9HYPH|nr:hypothetical protein [Brucella pseudogrignonensis]MDR6431285.1 hypothetical protein [Brucella pseudogrignonensis]
MSGSSATPGPWSQGVLLSTATTRRWSKEVREQVQADESLRVFSNFRAKDEGRGRKLVAVFERPEDAKLGSAAPDLLEAVYAALPFVEDALDDPAYKAGAVKKHLDTMKEAIAKAEGRDIA